MLTRSLFAGGNLRVVRLNIGTLIFQLRAHIFVEINRNYFIINL